MERAALLLAIVLGLALSQDTGHTTTGHSNATLCVAPGEFSRGAAALAGPDQGRVLLEQTCQDSCYFHGRCKIDGSCACSSGWLGEDCDEPTCENCVYGNCRPNYLCNCYPGYRGPSCDIPICLGVNHCCTLEGFCSSPLCTIPEASDTILTFF